MIPPKRKLNKKDLMQSCNKIYIRGLPDYSNFTLFGNLMGCFTISGNLLSLVKLPNLVRLKLLYIYMVKGTRFSTLLSKQTFSKLTYDLS